MRHREDRPALTEEEVSDIIAVARLRRENERLRDLLSDEVLDGVENTDLRSLAGELAGALTKAVHELNTIRARDGVPYTYHGWRSDVNEEYFSNVVDEGFAVLARAAERGVKP